MSQQLLQNTIFAKLTGWIVCGCNAAFIFKIAHSNNNAVYKAAQKVMRAERGEMPKIIVDFCVFI